MTLYELLDLIASQRELAFNTWNMFVAVHITIIGGLFLVNRDVSLKERLVACILYFVFLYMNWHAQVVNYTYIGSLTSAARALESQTACTAAACLAKELPSFANAKILVHIVYAVAAAATLLTVMLINRIAHKSAPSPTVSRH